MEEKVLRIMIERYFDAELTVEEERGLYHYLCNNDVPSELRKDKEAIIALCSNVVDVELPVGAMARLDAMLDEQVSQHECDDTVVANGKKSILNKPRYIISVAIAAAVVVMAYILVPAENIVLDETGGGQIAEIYEEDTFDNPEDAIQCLKMAIGDMQHATAIAHANTRKIGAILELSATMCKKQ